MADLKISQLTGATTPLAGTEVLPIVQSGSTVKVSVANLTAGRAVATAGGSFTDNITQSTAAKGVNFTANTPAAGMTSQLLNWYEEGTWTPSFSDGTTSVSGTAQKYTRIGRLVTCHLNLYAINISGLSTGILRITGLPFVSDAGIDSILAGSLTNNLPVIAETTSGTYVSLLAGSTVGNGDMGSLTKSMFQSTTAASLFGVILYTAA